MIKSNQCSLKVTVLYFELLFQKADQSPDCIQKVCAGKHLEMLWKEETKVLFQTFNFFLTTPQQDYSWKKEKVHDLTHSSYSLDVSPFEFVLFSKKKKYLSKRRYALRNASGFAVYQYIITNPPKNINEYIQNLQNSIEIMCDCKRSVFWKKKFKS